MLIETLQKKGTKIKKREKIGGRIEQLCDMYIDLESGAKKNTKNNMAIIFQKTFNAQLHHLNSQITHTSLHILT